MKIWQDIDNEQSRQHQKPYITYKFQLQTSMLLSIAPRYRYIDFMSVVISHNILQGLK